MTVKPSAQTYAHDCTTLHMHLCVCVRVISCIYTCKSDQIKSNQRGKSNRDTCPWNLEPCVVRAQANTQRAQFNKWKLRPGAISCSTRRKHAQHVQKCSMMFQAEWCIMMHNVSVYGDVKFLLKWCTEKLHPHPAVECVRKGCLRENI